MWLARPPKPARCWPRAAAVQPDVVLLDWELPGLRAANLLPALQLAPALRS